MPTTYTRARHILTTFRPFILSLGFSAAIPLRSFSAISMSAQKQGEATCTRYLPRAPSPQAARESPWPVVFLRARGLGTEEEGEWKDWSGMFAEKGYTAIEIDITAPTPSSTTVPDGPGSPFPQMVQSLSSQIRLSAIPFPPILVARGVSTLLAQAYISDFPASALVLVDPLPDSDPREELDKKRGGGWTWPVFGFEPHFPVLMISSQQRMGELALGNRLVREHAGVNPNKSGWTGLGRGKGRGVEIVVADGLDGQLGEGARNEVERWMDRAGF